MTLAVDNILCTDLARAFVAKYRAGWGHSEWVALVNALHAQGHTGFDESELGRALQHQRGLLEELTNNDYFWHFLSEHENGWDHADWEKFVHTIKTRGFEHLDENIVGLVLNMKREEQG